MSYRSSLGVVALMAAMAIGDAQAQDCLSKYPDIGPVAQAARRRHPVGSDQAARACRSRRR